MLPLALEFQHACGTPSDINEHCQMLAGLACVHKHVTEFGVRHGVSTIAFLAGRPRKLVSYDLQCLINVEDFKKMAPSTEYVFIQGDSRLVDIENTEMLFIDTYHTGAQLAIELERHHARVAKTIVMHDTETFGINGEDGIPGHGLLPALEAFLTAHPNWVRRKHFTNNNGLTIITRTDLAALPQEPHP